MRQSAAVFGLTVGTWTCTLPRGRITTRPSRISPTVTGLSPSIGTPPAGFYDWQTGAILDQANITALTGGAGAAATEQPKAAPEFFVNGGQEFPEQRSAI